VTTSLRRVFLSAVAALAIAVSATACAGTDSDSDTLTVGFVVDPSWAQIPVAAETGLFDDQDVKVNVVNFSSGVEALQALAAGQVDITTAADVPTSAAIVRNPALRIVGDGSRWRGSKIVARRDAGINTTADLAGKSVGTPLGTSAAYYISNALTAGNIEADLVQVSPSAVVTAVSQRNVDAVSIFQPYQAQAIEALGQDAVELTGGTYSQHSLYLSTETAISAKSEAITKFFSAIREAGASLTGKNDEAIDAVAKSTQLDANLLRSILGEFDFTLQLAPDLATNLHELAEWAQAEGNIVAGVGLPDYAKFLETRFVTP